MFLNDLQTGPSSCGCGNDQCRWALDYGSPPTAARTPGDDVAAQDRRRVSDGFPGKSVIPVWVTECEPIDLPGARGGTGFCGGVGCARATAGRVTSASGIRSSRRPTARRAGPVDRDLPARPRKVDRGRPGLISGPSSRRNHPEARKNHRRPSSLGKLGSRLGSHLVDRVKSSASNWILALDPIDQTWEPRAVPIPQSFR